VLYGWFDNHLCYISTLISHLAKVGSDGKRFWNTSEVYHFIGKDIVYHHYLLLPAMRMGLNEEYKLPDYIPTRGHLLLHYKKISKSRNWYISLRDFTSTFIPDYLRFYLASITPFSQTDINFDWDAFTEKINNELIANIGNFINRALSFILTRFSGRVPQHGEYDQYDVASLSRIAGIADEVGSFVSRLEIDRSLKRILNFATHFNQYFQMKKPWAHAETAQTTLFISVNAVRSLAIVLEPFIPFSCERIWFQLGMTDSVHKQFWSSASEMKLQVGHSLGEIKPIFNKIDEELVEKQKTGLKIFNG
jgi:methionyl-tRNA synthetase